MVVMSGWAYYLNISMGYKLQSMTMRHMSITRYSGQTMRWSSLTDTIEPPCIQSSHINKIHFEISYKLNMWSLVTYQCTKFLPWYATHLFNLGIGWKLVPGTYCNRQQGDTCPLHDVVVNPCQCDDYVENQLMDVRNLTTRKQTMCNPMAKRHMPIIGRSGVAMLSSSYTHTHIYKSIEENIKENKVITWRGLITKILDPMYYLLFLNIVIK